MKPLLLCCTFFILVKTASAQSLDYISVRKKNGSVVKNIYTGSTVLLQLTDGAYLQGPVQSIRNDSVFVTVFDIRYYPTTWGTVVRDTISTTIVGVYYKDISRVQLNKRRSFVQRTVAPLLMVGGAGYMVLNVLNGTVYNASVTGGKNLQKVGIAAGVFGVGYMLKRLFSSDGFSKKNDRIVYVDL